MRTVALPDEEPWHLEHLVLDLNGTLADHGRLVAGVAARLGRLGDDLEAQLLTADTHGTAGALARRLGLPVTIVRTGDEKAAWVQRLGPDRTVAIGNGHNDAAMLRLARLGIVVLGAEGTATAALLAADVVCCSVLDALDLLLDERSLVATLRP